MGYELIAAVDLGSNSFRLQVGRVVKDQIYPLDGYKETVRLAAGLGSDKRLDVTSQARGLAALERFGERLRGFAPGSVRAVATNTLRVAKNAREFLAQGQAALGFPIEVIAGREEARLIYVGVSHTLPSSPAARLVVDIGGGSTEFIIGQGHEPRLLESLYMGCVVFSRRFFADGRCDKRRFRDAELAAKRELETIVSEYRRAGWGEAYASSGTAKALAEVLAANGWSDGGITRDGLRMLRAHLVKLGNVGQMDLPGSKPERLPVLPGGLAIMLAIMDAFELEKLHFGDGALRLGVLYDLLGRFHHEDLRDATVEEFLHRYHVDTRQAIRVADTAARLHTSLRGEGNNASPDDEDLRFLVWGARLHEIGISIAHSGYHRHSAYILANADMPGFSRVDQARLAWLVTGHRGKLSRIEPAGPGVEAWQTLLCLRLAALLHRSRSDEGEPPVRLSTTPKGFQVLVEGPWLDGAPLTAGALSDEVKAWATVGVDLRLRLRRGEPKALV